MKLLVVDDVGFMRHYLRRLLEQNGYEVITADSGVDGLRCLAGDTGISAVICDLLMPGMDGIEFFQEAKAIPRYNDEGVIPAPMFILLTAMRPDNSSGTSEAGLLRRAVEVGFTEILLKPVDQKCLFDILNKCESTSV